jgi:hypothetical protein
MLTTTARAYSIRLIDEVSPADGGARVRFRDGSVARLESGHANFAHLLLWGCPGLGAHGLTAARPFPMPHNFGQHGRALCAWA